MDRTAHSQPPTSGIKTDPDAWGAALFLFGAPVLKVLSYFEHLQFLLSIREENFKLIFDLWESVGWFAVTAIGAIWMFNRFSKRELPHEKGPTWGLVTASVIMAFLFGGFLATRAAGGLPQVIMSYGVGITTPNNYAGCLGQIDGSRIISFKKRYKVALICVATDPQTDQLADQRIFVSNLFEIVAGPIPIVGVRSPSGEFKTQAQPLTINYFAVLVPLDVDWPKITTMGQLIREGGKILDPKYYQ
jgi:hypothetical protein